ncbi:MAG TPA: hypothetical protein VEU30_10885 [Thermoanaerobaculia bacterium]|nr:hypothetical protein [Thermoanaerobaculia bacterium]
MKSWIAYLQSYQSGVLAEARRPTMNDLAADTLAAFWLATEQAVISLTTLFETHVQCWTLNYLLALLESGGWSTAEAKLARRFSRVLFGTFTPNFPAILKDLPILAHILSEVPHARLDFDGNEVDVCPPTDNFNGR